MLRRYPFVSLSAVYLLIGLAGRAEACFELLDEPEDEAFLLVSCPLAHWAFKAAFRQLSLLFSDCVLVHFVSPLTMLLFPGRLYTQS